MDKNWSNFWPNRVVVSGSPSNWKPVYYLTLWQVPQEFVLRPLFHILIGNPEWSIKCTVIKLLSTNQSREQDCYSVESEHTEWMEIWTLWYSTRTRTRSVCRRKEPFAMTEQRSRKWPAAYCKLNVSQHYDHIAKKPTASSAVLAGAQAEVWGKLLSPFTQHSWDHICV